MKKYLYTLVGLALLLALLVPSTVMADDSKFKLPDKLVGLFSFDDGGWKFVIPGDYEVYAPCSFLITWDVGGTTLIELQRDAKGVAFYQMFKSQIPKGAKMPVMATFDFDGKTWQIPLHCPDKPIKPVPELPVVALMALGLAGLGTVAYLKRRTWLSMVS